MDRRAVPALVRLGFALLVMASIAAQLLDLATAGTLNPVNYFSYFTIQSNLIGAVAFLLVAAGWRRDRSPGLELLRGAATVYLTVTFVVFALLLSGTDVDTALPWVNTTLHRVFPVVVMLDWVFAPPVIAIPFRRSLVWLAYPIAWTAYTMARGLLTGWYPYPFLTPANGGYLSVVLYLAAILVFGIALCALVSAVSRWRGEPREEAARVGA